MLAGVGILLGTGGCTNPAINGSGGSGRATSSTGQGNGSGGSGAPPSPIAGATEAIAAEARLAALAIGVLARTGDNAPSKRMRTILEQIRDAHLAHLSALHSADPRQPDGGVPVATPSALSVPSATAKVSEAVKALIKQEQTAALDYQKRVGAAPAEIALLWASLCESSRSFAQALDSDDARSSTPLGLQRGPLAQLDQAQSSSQLLTQLNAALYGYEAALARLSGSQATDANERIIGIYQLRNTMRAKIIAAGGQASPAAPAYVLDPKPTSLKTALKLMAALETRMQPYLGQWLGTSVGKDRTAALGALSSSVSVGLVWGAPLNRWPGWVVSS